jgi:anhydro-N-acetylmuramic acid kinase
LWKEIPFFKDSAPKTTGPELFALDFMIQMVKENLNFELNPNDLLATLTRLSAETIAESIKKEVPQWEKARKFASGGGFHNKLLMNFLTELLPGSDFMDTASLGIPGDAKEAVLFAALANETLAGGNIDYGANVSVCMGKISLPR